MTHQFKFGDLVRCNGYPTTGVIVGLNDKDNTAAVCFVGLYHTERRIEINSLELIPHPDTVRLDWLADKNNNIGRVLLPVECVEKHLDSLRDAIDAAMKLYKVKDENNAKI